ncbi:MAG: TonB family protein [Melioribacteraceae bacterium]|nr:TonB family protein [Melioribacteraceae bacterium]
MCIQTYAQFSSDRRNIKLSFVDEPLRLLLSEIENQAGLNFIFKDELVKDKKISWQFNGSFVFNEFKELLKHLNIRAELYDSNHVVLYKEKITKKPVIRTLYQDEDLMIKKPKDEIIKPVIISKDKLEYPSRAITENTEGDVTLRLLVSESGAVSKSEIVTSSGSKLLDSSSVEYASRLKFVPARINGKTESVWMSIIFKFYIVENDSVMN